MTNEHNTLELESMVQRRLFEDPTALATRDPARFAELALGVLLSPEARAQHRAAFVIDDAADNPEGGGADAARVAELVGTVRVEGLIGLSPRAMADIFSSRGCFASICDVLDALDEEIEVLLAVEPLPGDDLATASLVTPVMEGGANEDVEVPQSRRRIVFALLIAAAAAALWVWAPWASTPAPAERAAPENAPATITQGAPEEKGESVVEEAPPREPSPQAWTASAVRFESSHGAVGLSVQAPGADTSAPWTSASAAVDAGSTIETDGATRARLMLSPRVSAALHQHTALTLDAFEGQTARVARGHIVIDAQGESARLLTDHGELVAEHAKFALAVEDEVTRVTVARGEVVVRVGPGATPQTVYAGEEATLGLEATPWVQPATDLGAALGWSALDDHAVGVARGLGALTAKRPGEKAEHPLTLERHDIKVKIQGAMARTEITEVFRNDTAHTLEGIYRFPLPADAQISRLALKVDDVLMEGEFVESAHAEKIWRGVIQNATTKKRPKEEVIWVPGPWKDPAMLRWEKGDQFELRIFPIEANSVREVTIAYTQRLDPSPGGREYVYPMPVDLEGRIPVERFSFEAAISGHDPTRPISLRGYHASVAQEGERAVVRHEASDFTAAGDLRLRYHLSGAERALRASGYRDPARPDELGYVAIALRPELSRATTRARKDMVWIVDTSYSRFGAAMQKQTQLIERLLSEMDPRDRVVVLACDEVCRPLSSATLSPGGSLDRESIVKALAQTPAEGATNLLEGVLVASRLLAAQRAPGHEARVLYFTDAVASAGPLDLGPQSDAISRAATEGDVRISFVDVGGSADAVALATLARAGGGAAIHLDPSATLTTQAFTILGTQYGEALRDVVIELPEGLTQIEPATLPALQAGSELLVLARADAPIKGEVVLRGTRAGEVVERRYDLAVDLVSASGNAFVPRLWAEQRILSRYRVEDVEAREEIVQLSLRHGLLTRYTTLLALESEAMMDAFGLERVNRPEWSGDESVDEAVSGAVINGPMKRSKKKTARRPRRSTPSAKPAPRPESKPTMGGPGGASGENRSGILDMDDGDFKNEGKKAVERRSRPRRRDNRTEIEMKRMRVARIQGPKVRANTKTLTRIRDDLAVAPDSRTAHRALALELARTGDLEGAQRVVDRWLERDRMDTEALLISAMIAAREGDPERARRWLGSALDTSPRSLALHEQVIQAHRHFDDAARVCLHGQSVAALTPEAAAAAAPCGVASSSALFPGASFASSPAIEAEAGRSRGDIVVTLEWSGEAMLQLNVVAPDGRVGGWFSHARQSRTRIVDLGDGRRRVEIGVPYLAAGRWLIEAQRADGGVDAVNAKLTIRALGKKETTKVEVSGAREVLRSVLVKREWRETGRRR